MKSGLANTKRITLNGILIALTVVTLLFATVLPTSRLSLYALSSFYVSIVIVEYGIRNGWAFYFASGLLALIVIPDKIGLIPYAIFFGLYGIIKFYLEKISKIYVEYIVKLIYFNASLLITILLIREFFFSGIKVAFPWWTIVIALEIIFVLYDYVYTLFVRYYKNKLKRVLKI